MPSIHRFKPSLRIKGVLVVLALLGSITLVADRTLEQSMRQSYEELEREALHSDMLQLSDALDQQLQQLNEVAREWGYWTEMANYTGDQNQAFRNEYLSSSSLKTSELQGVAIFDPAGRQLSEAERDTAHGALFRTLMQAGSPTLHVLLADPTTKNSLCGMSQGEEVRLLLCHHPIRDTNGEGPVRGTLVIARSFDQHTLQQLSRQTRLPLQLSSSIAPPVGTSTVMPLEHLSSVATRAQLVRTTRETLTATLTLRDLHGQDVAEIAIDWPRTITLRGEHFLQLVRQRMALLNLVGVLVVLLLIDRTIASPLLSLRDKISAIALHSGWSKRLPAQRRDEIGDVARSTNVMLDVIEKQMDELHALSNTNQLTGLPNRRAFDQSLSTALALARRSGRPLALVMLDLDRFKQYNDLLGHVEGDRALQIFADCLRESVHRPTDFPARYGGEEFVVLLEETRAEGAKLCAETVLYNLRQRNIHHPGNPPLFVLTASAGVAMALPDDTPKSLLRRADEALYASKAQGRDQVTMASHPNDAAPAA